MHSHTPQHTHISVIKEENHEEFRLHLYHHQLKVKILIKFEDCNKRLDAKEIVLVVYKLVWTLIKEKFPLFRGALFPINGES